MNISTKVSTQLSAMKGAKKFLLIVSIPIVIAGAFFSVGAYQHRETNQHAIADKPPTSITLTKEESETCAKEGGCIALSQLTVDTLISQLKALQEQAENVTAPLKPGCVGSNR